MARMWTWGGARGWRARAVSATVAVTLVAGAVVAVVTAADAVGRPPTSTPGVPSDPAPGVVGGRGAVEGRSDERSVSPAAGMAVALSLVHPGPAGPGTAAADPTEAAVAARLIAAIDAASGGRYAIRATPDNVDLLETWMDNEGGLWADNPLNTSLDAARYPHQFTTTGVDTTIPIFPDIQIGIDATATTLLSSSAYRGILWTLSEGTATCGAFAQAVMASPWAASHYGDDASHFCDDQGGPGTPGTVVTACLRVGDGRGRDGRRWQRMPGACGRETAGAGRSGVGRRQRRKQQADRPAPPSHGRRTVSGASSSRDRQPLGHLGSVAGAVGNRHRR